jgi:crossover junction endodeoxyribonuclease RuvC
LRRLRRPRSLAELVSPKREAALPAQVRILGLDPGSLRTGYAIVETGPTRIGYVVSGAIKTEGATFTERLREIFEAVDKLTGEFRPDEVAIESVFMHRNADSALKLGQARGAALSATFAAEKVQVQLMVKRLLNISGPIGADAADALAIALCHAHSRKLRAMVSVAAGLQR